MNLLHTPKETRGEKDRNWRNATERIGGSKLGTLAVKNQFTTDRKCKCLSTKSARYIQANNLHVQSFANLCLSVSLLVFFVWQASDWPV